MSRPAIQARTPIPPTASTGRHEVTISLVRDIRVDANGTAWRLRSLIAMGHDSARLGRALGVPPFIVQRIVHGKTGTVTAAFRDLACQLWDAWWCYTPPAATPAQRRAATGARRMARRNNWPCPLALDEPDPQTGDLGMDAPGYRAYSRWRPATGLGVAPDFPPASQQQNAKEIA